MRTVAGIAGVVVLAVGITACDATRSTSTEPALYEGAKISLTGSSSVAVPGLDGRLVSVATHEWATDAIVTKGIAEGEQTRPTDAVMPALAITDEHILASGRANQRQFLTALDRSGNAQEFVVINGDRGPAKTIVHLENQKIAQAYSFEWKKVRGGWVAVSFTATVFKDGKVMARIRSTSRKLAPSGPAGLISPDDPCWTNQAEECDYGGGSGGSGGGGLGSGGPCCGDKLNDYLMASWAAATATQAAIDSGTLLVPWVAMGIAGLWAAAAIYLSRYNACYQQYCVTASGSTTGAFFAVVDPLDPKYFRRSLT
jgi:hypothetical protein